MEVIYLKKFKTGIILSIIISCLFIITPVSAENYTSDVVVSLQINNPVMEVNGIATEIDAGRDTAPIVTNGRTLVPIRAIIEAFNGNVSWEQSTQTVSLTMYDDVIKLVINSPTAYLNNIAYLF